MKKILKWIAISLVVIVILSFTSMYIWSQQTLAPTEQLKQLVALEEIVNDDGDVVILPQGEPKAGIILYPGAKVENTAYSYYGQKLAEEGYAVFIPKLRMNFAIFDQKAAGKFIEDYEEIDHWFVGGHSLGGVSAATFAKNTPRVEGLILLASYPSSGTDLSDESLKVISIYGEKDGLTQLVDIEESKALLPNATNYAEIKGGNHAQFGIYGEQKGDNEAELPVIEQQNFLIQATLDWLQKNN